MKKIIFHTILCGALLTAGCNKWLDVKPVTEATKDEMFSTQKGFRDALTGAYIHMKSGAAYGGSLMWGNIEYMAKSWDVANASATGLASLVNANYNDADVKTWMADTYAAEYKVIADVNSILENIDAKKTIFLDDNYRLIKGEALALRAFAHFDVMRMFGPMPDNPGDVRVLPYVQAVSSEVVVPSAYQEFMQHVLADLDEAEALLKEVDPVMQYSISELNPGANSTGPAVVPDDYYLYRQVRMNYYAVLALKARVYMWLAPQDPSAAANAARYAKMVIDAKDRNGNPTFRLGKASDAANMDNTMSPEHIAALSVYNLETIADNLFGEKGSLVRSDFNIQDGFYYLNNLFPVSERTSDIRWRNMWVYKPAPGGTPMYVLYKKYIQRPGAGQLQVPLLRLSEMYFIMTECAQDKTEAESYYSAYCAEKGIPFTNGFTAGNWELDRKNKMIREYVRELYAEGQTFFTYKRYNVTTLPASWTANYYNGNAARYIVPKPDREINYHNN